MYYSIVRIFKKSNKYDLDNFRRHITKATSSASIFLVEETSPEGVIHAHALVRACNPEEGIKLVDYIDTVQLKVYIDRIREIPIKQVPYYVKYMCKDINAKSVKYKDYMTYGKCEEFIRSVNIVLASKLNPPPSPADDDPFIDSENNFSLNNGAEGGNRPKGGIKNNIENI